MVVCPAVFWLEKLSKLDRISFRSFGWSSLRNFTDVSDENDRTDFLLK